MAKTNQSQAPTQSQETQPAKQATAGVFRVKSGVHCESDFNEDGTVKNTRVYETGMTVESVKDLAKWDPNKFEAVGPGSLPSEPGTIHPVIQETDGEE